MTVPTSASSSLASSSASGSRRSRFRTRPRLSAGRPSFSAATDQKARTASMSSSRAGQIVTGFIGALCLARRSVAGEVGEDRRARRQGRVAAWTG